VPSDHSQCLIFTLPESDVPYSHCNYCVNLHINQWAFLNTVLMCLVFKYTEDLVTGSFSLSSVLQYVHYAYIHFV